MPISPITFDLTGSDPSATSMSFQEGELSLTISSALYNGGATGNKIVFEFSTPTLSMTSSGIGALNTYRDVDVGFDAHGMYELATFSFDQSVRITSVTLIPLGTRYNLTAVNTQFVVFGQGLVYDVDTLQMIDPTDFTNDLSITGSFIGIGAVTQLDSFRVASITVVLVALDAAPDNFAMKSDDFPRALDVLANDNNALSITAIDTMSMLGAISIAPDGLSLLYDAGNAFDHLGVGETQIDTFSYTVLGTDGTTQIETVTVTVTGNTNRITGTGGSNSLTGMVGRDIILGLAGKDTIFGNDGNDDINGGLNRDSLQGGNGNDRIDGSTGDDFVHGDSGNDIVIGGEGNDRLYGGDGDDSLDGATGTDRLFGDAGNDLLTAGESANILNGGSGVDTMMGGGGKDTYFVDNTDDLIVEFDTGGTDTVHTTIDWTLGDYTEKLVLLNGGATNATGNALSNRLTGNAGNNVLSGLQGDDRLVGSLGNDKLIGGIGRDMLIGGKGADEFHFAEFGSTNFDTVVDFNGLKDSLQLSNTAFGLSLGMIDKDVLGFGTAATTLDQRLVYNQATGNLYFDADGSGSGARQQIAALAVGTLLTYEDIFSI